MSTDQVFGGRFHFLAIKLSVLQREDEAILLRHRPTQNRSVSVELSLGRDQSMKIRADSDQGTGTDPCGKMDPHGIEHILRVMIPVRIEMKDLAFGMDPRIRATGPDRSNRTPKISSKPFSILS